MAAVSSALPSEPLSHLDVYGGGDIRYQPPLKKRKQKSGGVVFPSVLMSQRNEPLRIRHLQSLIVDAIANPAGVRKNKKYGPLISHPSLANMKRCVMVVVPYLSRQAASEGGVSEYLARCQQHYVGVLAPEIYGSHRECPILTSLLLHVPASSDKVRFGSDTGVGSLLSQNADSSAVPATPTEPPRAGPAIGLASLLVKEEEFKAQNFPLNLADWRERTLKRNQTATTPRSDAPPSHIFSSFLEGRSKVSLHNSLNKFIPLYKQDPLFPKLLAVDCEMCDTVNGKELTRVSIVRPQICVDAAGTERLNAEVLLDTLVLPESRILDYLDQFSGITAEALKDVKVTLDDVQLALSQIVHDDSVLVGHSLENDYAALKIFHPRAIDTALAYPHKRWGSFNSLRFLAERYFSRKIHHRKTAHSSVEDAQVPLELSLLKSVSSSPDFGGVASTAPQSMGALLANRGATGKLSSTTVEVFDRLEHKLDARSLKACEETTTCYATGGDDESVVRKFIEVKKSTSSDSEPRLRVCILRDYQRLCHEKVGGSGPCLTPRDIYSITPKVRSLMRACKRAAAPKTPIPPPPSTNTTSASQEISAMANAIQQLADSLEEKMQPLEADAVESSLPTDSASSEELDDEARLWVEQNVKKQLIVSPLLPIKEGERRSREIISKIGLLIESIYGHLKADTLFVVLSPMGDPLQFLVTSMIRRGIRDSANAAWRSKKIADLATLEQQEVNGMEERNSGFAMIRPVTVG